MENEEVELEELEEVVEETTEEIQQNTKTYSEEELNQMLEEQRTEINKKNQEAWNKRWGQEKSKMEREFAKKQEAIDLFMNQTKTNSIDDLLDTAYEEYGVERPKNAHLQRDEERLGKLDAQDMFELDDDSINEELNRLSKLKRTPREEAMFMELGQHMTNKLNVAKRNLEIKENGLDESIVNSEEFKEFSNKFNKDTSLKDIYDIFGQTRPKTKSKPFSAGSANGIKKAGKEPSEIFTPEEFDALTDKDLEDDKVYAKAMKTVQYYNS